MLGKKIEGMTEPRNQTATDRGRKSKPVRVEASPSPGAGLGQLAPMPEWEGLVFPPDQAGGQMTPPRTQALHTTGFELVSYAMPGSGRNRESPENQERDQTRLAGLVNMALGALLQGLPQGTALVAEYVLQPKRRGALALSCKLGVQAPAEQSARLTQDLAVCLATLSDHFGFREANLFAAKSTHPLASRVIRTRVARCLAQASGAGFTTMQGGTCPVLLPIPEATAMGTGKGNDPAGVAHLGHFFKAARAARHGLRVRIKLERDALPQGTRAHLQGLLDRNPSVYMGLDDAGRLASQSSLVKLLEHWLAQPRDILRLSAVVDFLPGHPPADSLLRLLAGALFPGLRVEWMACQDCSDTGREQDTGLDGIDLSSALPLSGTLPTLLPAPATLEALNFPRHFDNPAVELPAAGILLGHAQVGGFEQPVRLTQTDRSRHVYLLGATGTGKSSLLLNMMRQDMEAGRGMALLDPHGDLFQMVRDALPAERREDLLVIDPSDEASPISLNPLDFGSAPSIKRVNRVINDLLDIFAELWDMKVVGGPGFELYFRNTALLACTAPEDIPPIGLPKGPPTLLTLLETMRDEDYRRFLLKHYETSFLGKDLGGEVERFFQSASRTTGEQSFDNWVPYVTNKLTRFTSNTLIRRLLCTPRRSVHFRPAMDQGAIILVNLSKGYLGSLDTRMLGMLTVKELFYAALSRGDVANHARRPFYLYLDEFQNFISPEIPDMLSEARKYGLHLTLAHQTLGQLKHQGEAGLLSSVLGNVGSRLVFRVGLQEAQELDGEYKPQFDAHAMAALPDRSVLARILVHNRPSMPFVFRTAHCPTPWAEPAVAA